MHRLAFIGITALLALASSAVASGGIAPFDGGITPTSGGQGTSLIQKGKCSASSTSWLKVKRDAGSTQVAFNVNQNKVGKDWDVSIARNGSILFSGTVTTQAPSGSFTVQRSFLPPGIRTGATSIVAIAKARDGSERCSAAITF
jgi:hypothetical protein